MKALRIITRSAITACFLLSTAAFSFGGEQPVTPYGAYCRDCAVYGACKETIPPAEAVHALRKYYRIRGYRLGNITHKGRFIEAEVLKNHRPVDSVIFDRKTGRLRSVY